MLPTHDDVLRAFHQNSQAAFDNVVETYIQTPHAYDAKAYERNGVTVPHYSHVHHLGCIYARQIRVMSDLLSKTDHERFRVLDLGTCGGNFILSSARYFASRGDLSRIHFVGIDRSDQDMRFGKEMAGEIDKLSVDWEIDDIMSPGFADRLRRYDADFIVANHVLEHLSGEDLTNRYLQDWLLAANCALSISVPLGDECGDSISDHTVAFDSSSVETLALNMEIRVGFAIETPDIDETKYAGLWTWIKNQDIAENGGFCGETLTITPKEISP